MRRARAAPLARSELCASCRHTAVDFRAASMLVLTCCVRSESSPRRCERMRCCCRCYSAALWRRHGCIGPFGRMRVCCDSAATFGVGACRLANWLGALSSSCASPTCASPSLTFLALSRHVITLDLSLASACVPGWRCWRRPRCVLATCSEGKPCTCEDMYSPGAPGRRAPCRELAPKKKLEKIKREQKPVICRRPTLSYSWSLLASLRLSSKVLL